MSHHPNTIICSDIPKAEVIVTSGIDQVTKPRRNHHYHHFSQWHWNCRCQILGPPHRPYYSYTSTFPLDPLRNQRGKRKKCWFRLDSNTKRSVTIWVWTVGSYSHVIAKVDGGSIWTANATTSPWSSAHVYIRVLLCEVGGSNKDIRRESGLPISAFNWEAERR
jgi:hypothetical protein